MDFLWKQLKKNNEGNGEIGHKTCAESKQITEARTSAFNDFKELIQYFWRRF